MNSFEHNLHGSLIFSIFHNVYITRTDIKFVDLGRYSKDEYKRIMGELVKYEEFVTDVNVTKSIRGGKIPNRIYQIIIMDPDAVTEADLSKLKKGPQPPEEEGVPKK